MSKLPIDKEYLRNQFSAYNTNVINPQLQILIDGIKGKISLQQGASNKGKLFIVGEDGIVGIQAPLTNYNSESSAPISGLAVKDAISTLATAKVGGEGKYIQSIVENQGIITAIEANADFATSVQGNRADSAVQTIKVKSRIDESAKTYQGNDIVLPDYPTSLPASDVYDWAKASTRPEYSFNDLTSHPNNLAGYGIQDAATSAQGAKADSAVQTITFDGNTYSGQNITLTRPSYSFSELTDKPTTLQGYGIIDAATAAQGSKADSAIQGAIQDGIELTINNQQQLVLPSFPTSLPASDVYSWAKAVNKPTYNFSEILNKPLGEPTIVDADGTIISTGIATLDSHGKVPSSQLPSFVDDVIEGYLSGGKFYKESAHTTEISGESGKIYIDLSTEKTYRWSGSTFVVISETLALGETYSTAYRGDRGKIAYDHSQSTHARTDATKVEKSSTNGNIKINGTETIVYTHPSGTNPHGTTKSDVGLGNVGNFKAVSTVASQGLSDTEKSNARANIGAGTSSFSGSYNDLTNKPTIPTVGNGTVTIKQDGTTKGTFTMNQSGNTTIELTGNNTTYGVATSSALGLVKSGTDITVDSSGNVSVNDYSHNHVISNVDGLQSALDGKAPSDHTHNYAGSSSAGGSANSSNCLVYTGTGWGCLTAHQTQDSFMGSGANWASYIICNHGNGETYYNQTIRMPFYGAPQYARLEGGVRHGWFNFITDENIASQSVASAASLVDYGNTSQTIKIGFGGAGATTDNLGYIAGYINNGTQIKDVSKDTLKSWLGLGVLTIVKDEQNPSSAHMYIGSNTYPHLIYQQYSNNGHLYPNTNGGCQLGTSDQRWCNIYGINVYNSSGAITTSDRNKKHDIEEISDEFSEKIVDGLIPSSFKFNDGSSGRIHFGIIAQDLEKLLETLGISTTDFAPLVKDYPDKEVEIENPDYDENDECSQKYIKKLEKDYDAEPTYNVRYEEFIMILVKYCQGLKKKTLDMEQRMDELEKKVNKLIAG